MPDGSPVIGSVIVGGGLPATGLIEAASFGDVTVFARLGGATITAPDGQTLMVTPTAGEVGSTLTPPYCAS
jgi:hypothetical protein